MVAASGSRGRTAPPEVGNDEVLAALADEMRADFARDGIRAFAGAYPCRAVTPAGRVRAVAVEAHGSDHLCGLREVVHLNGRRPELGALTTVSVGIARYTGLLVEGVPA
jgi:hypothetical protein